MRRHGRRFGLIVVVALALGSAVAITPAGAASVPSAPAQPKASPGNLQARVTWVAPANGGSAINEYVVTPFVGTTAKTPRVFHSTAVTQLITSLVNGTSYTFRVKAHNAVGFGTASVASSAIRVGAPTAPAKPIATRGNATVRVNWSLPLKNGSAITGDIVTPFIGTVAQTARVFNSTLRAQDITGLVNGTAYTFKVAAKNSFGVGPKSVASVAARPTAQPTLKLAMNATIGQPILVNSAGMTVYMFVPDGSGTTSQVTGALRSAWPYVTWGGAVTVGSGLTLASATANIQPDNSRLMAYNGHLLYTFVGDQVPGDVTGQGLNQFFVLDASGNEIP